MAGLTHKTYLLHFKVHDSSASENLIDMVLSMRATTLFEVVKLVRTFILELGLLF